MKRFNVSKVLGSTVLALSLATLPTVLPASAQTNTSAGGSTVDSSRNAATDRTVTDQNHRDGDWGLLGLLGLFGLLGRKSRKNNESAGYGNPDVVGSSGRSNY